MTKLDDQVDVLLAELTETDAVGDYIPKTRAALAASLDARGVGTRNTARDMSWAMTRVRELAAAGRREVVTCEFDSAVGDYVYVLTADDDRIAEYDRVRIGDARRRMENIKRDLAMCTSRHGIDEVLEDLEYLTTKLERIADRI